MQSYTRQTKEKEARNIDFSEQNLSEEVFQDLNAVFCPDSIPTPLRKNFYEKTVGVPLPPEAEKCYNSAMDSYRQSYPAQCPQDKSASPLFSGISG